MRFDTACCYQSKGTHIAWSPHTTLGSLEDAQKQVYRHTSISANWHASADLRHVVPLGHLGRGGPVGVPLVEGTFDLQHPGALPSNHP